MKVTYTKSRLIAYARRISGFDCLRADCGAERADGVDVDALLGDALRRWYLALLDNGPVGYLAPEELTVVAANEIGVAGGTSMTLPENCRRVLWLRLPGWHHGTVPLAASEADRVVLRQLNPYTASTPSAPVAVLAPSGRSVTAWPAAAEYGTPKVMAAADTGEDSFVFDDSALATLPEFLQTVKIVQYADI